MLQKSLFATLVLILFLPLLPLSAQNSAGFVPGDIWYSKDPFVEGDKIKIYTVLFNPDSREFSGTVRFFDKETLLGKKDFKIGGKLIKDVSIDWTVTPGNHAIYARIENARFLVSPGKYEQATVSDTQTEESRRTVAKKVTPKPEDEEGGENDTGFDTMEELGVLIEEKTPAFIAKPLVSAAGGIEAFRAETATSSKEKKAEIKEELAAEPTENSGKLDRPFKYIKLFFLNLISLITGNQILFYIVSVGMLFSIFRLVWKRI